MERFVVAALLGLSAIPLGATSDECTAGAGSAAGACSSVQEDGPAEIGLVQLRAASQRQQQHLSAASKRSALARAAARRGSMGAARRAERAATKGIPADFGAYFEESYGNGYRWYIGQVSQDVLDFVGATAPVTFGLLEAGSVEIGDIWPPGGESLTDGFLGLAPGCLDTGCAKKTDVLSSLVRGGALTAHVFTLCLHDSVEGGGSLSLGPPGVPLPSSVTKLPVEVGHRHYQLKSLDGNVSVSLGEYTLTTYSPSEWYSTDSIVDSGTGGFLIPEKWYWHLLYAVYSYISANAACHATWLKPDWPTFNHLLYGREGATRDMVACATPLIPDLSVQLGSAESLLVVDGAAFFYPITPCASRYHSSWLPGSEGSSQWIFGTAFLVGKTVQFNAEDFANAHLTVLGHSSDDACTTDWSEGSSHFTKVSGSRAQLLSPQAGVITAEIALGTPAQSGFVVQLDTGSQDLLVYHSECMMYGNPDCQGQSSCESCISWVTDDPHPSLYYVTPFSHKDLGGQSVDFSTHCTEYLANITFTVTASGVISVGNLHNIQSWGPLDLGKWFKLITGRLQPYAKCGASRKECKNLHSFNFADSSTFLPKNLQLLAPTLPTPPFTAPIDCGSASVAPCS